MFKKSNKKMILFVGIILGAAIVVICKKSNLKSKHLQAIDNEWYRRINDI